MFTFNGLMQISKALFCQELYGNHSGGCVCRVNDSKYGLQAGIFTHDLDKVRPLLTNLAHASHAPARPGVFFLPWLTAQHV